MEKGNRENDTRLSDLGQLKARSFCVFFSEETRTVLFDTGNMT